MGFFKRNKPNKPNVEIMEKSKDFEGLIEALNHKDLDVQRNAAGALGRLGNPQAVAPLIEVLSDPVIMRSGEHLYLLTDVASALGEIGDKRAVKPLKDALERDFPSSGGFSSLEEAASYGAEMHRRITHFKETAEAALEKIRAK